MIFVPMLEVDLEKGMAEPLDLHRARKPSVGDVRAVPGHYSGYGRRNGRLEQERKTMSAGKKENPRITACLHNHFPSMKRRSDLRFGLTWSYPYYPTFPWSPLFKGANSNIYALCPLRSPR